MDREYEVLTDNYSGGKKGSKVSGPVHPALVGVHLKDVTPPEKLRCPACQNEPKATKKAKEQTYGTAGELAEHYASEHPALAAPAEEEV